MRRCCSATQHARSTRVVHRVKREYPLAVHRTSRILIGTKSARPKFKFPPATFACSRRLLPLGNVLFREAYSRRVSFRKKLGRFERNWVIIFTPRPILSVLPQLFRASGSCAEAHCAHENLKRHAKKRQKNVTGRRTIQKKPLLLVSSWHVWIWNLHARRRPPE